MIDDGHDVDAEYLTVVGDIGIGIPLEEQDDVSLTEVWQKTFIIVRYG